MKTLSKLTAIAALLCAITAVSSEAATLTLKTEPALKPLFSSSQRDYTVRCPDNKVKVNLNSTDPASLDQAPARSGQQSKTVALTAGQRFVVKVAGKDYSVRCLPEDLIDATITGKLPPSMPFLAIGVNRVLDPGKPTFAIITDRRGVPLWFKQEALPMTDVKFVGRNQIGYWSGSVVDGGLTKGAFKINRLNGTVARSVTAIGAGSDVHEAYLRKNGNWLVLAGTTSRGDMSAFGGKADSGLFYSDIQEITPQNTLAFSWKSEEYTSPLDAEDWLPGLITFQSGDNPLDMIHLNSIDEDKRGNLITSARHHNAIYKISRQSSEIIWKLGGHKTDKSLTVIGDDKAKLFFGQHDARIYKDGLTVYDNGTGAGRAPRVARYQIDEQKRTARLVEEITNPLAPSSQLAGGARKLSDGSWIISWSHNPLIDAYDKRGREIFQMRFQRPALSYRAVTAARNQVSRQGLIKGMDQMFPRR